LLLGQSPELVSLASLYLHALAWGLLPKFILIVMFELILGLGHTRVIMIVTMITIPFYIFMSFVLIFGKFGFPMLGIAGAGWGMTISDWIITSVLSILLLFSKNYGSYIRSIFTFKRPSYVWEIVHLGLPMGAMYCIEVAFFFAMALLMGRLSVHSLAANQLVMQYMCTLMSVIFSIAGAITVRMGHQLGAKQIESAERSAYSGVLLSAFFMFIASLFYWITPGALISVFFNLHDKNNIETIQLATQFLFIAAFFQILESIRISLFGALRGLKDTHFSLVASIICFWCVALPMGYLFSTKLKIHGAGFWLAMVIGVICSILLLLWRFKLKIRDYHRKELSVMVHEDIF
jgi:MATE family multidrug resistance protein